MACQYAISAVMPYKLVELEVNYRHKTEILQSYLPLVLAAPDRFVNGEVGYEAVGKLEPGSNCGNG
jgi:hypothetical protein